MKSPNPFYRLPSFIQEFIYKNKWDEMRQIQIDACNVIFDTDKHLIIASGTASGKTEAAFFPIITDLNENPVNSIHTLYISPLKALINDQFLRLNEILKEAYIPVWQWHGDVLKSHKDKLIKNPSGILQITPESLESLFINRSSSILTLFKNLKFVVIDEIHSFMGTERGFQVLCLLSRISSVCNVFPRRIGLSATLGNYSYAKSWLKNGSNIDVLVSSPPSSKRIVNIALEIFKNYLEENPEEESLEHYEFIYKNTLNKKSIIFTNSRGEAENTIFYLRRFAKKNNTIDNFYIHHGSISQVLRQETETILKNEEKNSVVAATVTLELGIDIGDLDRIVQIGSPHSCSSFIQRLGRSGRRTGRSEILFINVEELKRSITPEFIPWDMLQSIAIIELYVKEKWLESPKDILFPYSLLYHQTMSILLFYGELSPKDLLKKVLSMPPFKKITIDDYRILLNHLISINHIEKMEDGNLIIGLNGEKVVNNFHFYAVFKDSLEYRVIYNANEIGTLSNAPPEKTTILLSGKAWIVTEVDLNNKTIFVVPSKNKAQALWVGSTLDIDDKIIEKIKDILTSDEKYSYLKENAQKRLNEARRYSSIIHIKNTRLIQLADNTFCFIPWMGSIKMNTLNKFFKNLWNEELEIKSVEQYSCYFFIIISSLKINEFEKNLEKLLKESYKENILDKLIIPEMELKTHKFDDYIPIELRHKAYLSDNIDIDFLTNYN